MPTTMSTAKLERIYERAARDYCRSLPPEHFMEAIGQGKQREITLESLALLKTRRPDVQVFNELLVQYPLQGQRKLGQVCPDNMVVLCEEPIQAKGSFNLPLEPAAPFWVLEYVSKHNERKDYKESFVKYERDLKVPYYLVFHPEQKELTLHRHTGKKYVPVKPNKNGWLPIPQLDLELGLLEGWVRYWYQGKLLPLPAELERDLDEAKRRAAEEEHRADELQRRLEDAEQELARLRGTIQPPQARRNGGESA